ncbi:MAG: hypothetical protein J6V72_10095 [Kiritimatiellae bacterium]|nr:hypothetical protein [Kiritimatiellia bacterium]
MTWKDFEKAYNFREADKCCANCKHGEVEYEGECTCNHPLIDKYECSGNMINNVCDLWEKEGGEG